MEASVIKSNCLKELKLCVLPHNGWNLGINGKGSNGRIEVFSMIHGF